MIAGITGIRPTHGHLVKKEGTVPNTTQKVPGQKDMIKGKITKRGRLKMRRAIILTLITEKKRKILIGTKKLIIAIPIGRGMNKKIN